MRVCFWCGGFVEKLRAFTYPLGVVGLCVRCWDVNKPPHDEEVSNKMNEPLQYAIWKARDKAARASSNTTPQTSATPRT
jgi:hypothetical protein